MTYTLGIQIGHNSSVCLYKNNKLIYYNQEERLSRLKRDSSFPNLCIEQVKKITSKVTSVLVTSYDAASVSLVFVKHQLEKIKLIESKTLVYFLYKGHHLTHATKAYFSSNFKNALIFVIDGRGSCYNLSNGSIGFETASVYTIDYPNEFKSIYKKIYTNQKQLENIKVRYDYEPPLAHSIKNIYSITEETIFEIGNQYELALFYSSISNYLNFKDEEGKLMGLSAYGKENILINHYLKQKDFLTPDLNINIKKYKDILKFSKEDLSYETQLKFEQDYFLLVNKFINKYKDYKNIILTGGTALNVVNNYKLKKHFKNHNIYVEPLCGDEGNSIGACQHYLYRTTLNDNFEKVNSLYLGPKYKINISLKNKEIIKKCKITKIVDLLINKNIVAVYQDKAEAGPRALGNRSLLMDPRIKNGKYIMNKIKGREQFRPLACCVLEEYAEQWFDISNSPHMMYACQAKENTKKIVPSIVHEDNTCRIQTINKKQNLFLYNLLKEFYKKTKVPMLMNTSFNLKGEPIVETPEDAVNVLRNSKINYLYFSKNKKLITIY
jgi:carbamoyltransferase